MAAQSIPIMGFATVPDNSGRAFFEPYPIKATSDLFQHMVLALNDPTTTQTHGIHGKFRVPQSYVGSAMVRAAWTSTAITGNIILGFDYRALTGINSESLDQATFQQEIDISILAPTSVNNLVTALGCLTPGNFSPGDEVEFNFYRDGTTGVGSDDLAAAVTVHGVYFEFADA